ARRYVEQLRELQPQGPYCLGGYSFGGSVAYEMAQQLQADGQKVALLAILDHTPPPDRYRSALRRPSFLVEFLENTPHWIADDLMHYGIRKIVERVRLRIRALGQWAIAALCRQTGSAPAEVEMLFDVTRMPAAFRKQLEGHHRALRAYQPKPYTGRITL